jgi:NADH-quinone oxidoreductase subunit A
MNFELLAGLSWTPGFRGLLSVLVGVVVLYGSVALILGTNSGARLGFQLALTGLAGWFFVMGFIWAIYGIGYLGPAAHWKVVDTIEGPPGAPDGARLRKARTLPLPSDLPNPVELRNADEDLLAEFPVDAKDPLLGDLAGASEEIRDQINDQLNGGWKILETSNKFTGETQTAASEYLVEHGMFVGQYLPVLVMLVLGAGFAGASLVMSKLVSPKRPSAAKSAPYECGIVPRPRTAGALPGALLPGGDDLHRVRHRDHLLVPLRRSTASWAFGLVRDDRVRHRGVRLVRLPDRQRRPRLGSGAEVPPTREAGMVNAARTTTTTVRRVGLEGREAPDL